MPKDSLPVSIEYRNALRLQFNTKLIRQPLTPRPPFTSRPNSARPTQKQFPSIPPPAQGRRKTEMNRRNQFHKSKDSKTWSETLRHEPKTGKNGPGYWTDPADFAEWEFQVTKPGRYRVSVFHGCGGGDHGGDVEIKLGDQALKFTTLDAGGFQNWKEVPVAEIEIKAAGKHRLMIDPVNKVKSAVLDVQKIVLTPAN